MMKLFKLPVKIERKAKLAFLILMCSLAAFGQVQVSPFPLLKENLLDANGKPLAAGCVNFYAAGTTTPQATYADSTGVAQNPNPIVLDAAGRVPSGSSIWLSSAAYKIRVFSAGSSNCASGTLQWEIDNFRTFSSLSGTETLSNKTLTAPVLTSPTSTGTDSGTETLVNKSLTSPVLTTPTVGGGQTLTKMFLATGTLTYGGIAAQTCQEQPLTVSGASANTGAWAASPNPGLGNVNLSWSAHTDAVSNTVLVRVCNPTIGAITPSAVSWTVFGVQ